jgi:cytochrome c oxidase subunit 2
MPIVVKAVPKAEFQQWLAAEKAKRAPVAAPAQTTPTEAAAPADAEVPNTDAPAAAATQHAPVAG